jgi:hypothetical protein
MKIIQIFTWKLELVSLIFVKNYGEKYCATVYSIFNYALYYIYCKRIEQDLKNHN